MSELFASPAFLNTYLLKLQDIRTPWTVGTADELDGYGHLIQKSKQLKSLDLQTERIGKDRQHGPLNGQLMAEKLFGPVLSQTLGAALELTKLKVKLQCIGTAPNPLLQAVDFTRLKSLSLEFDFHCEDRHLLEALTTLFAERGSALKGFTYQGGSVARDTWERFLAHSPDCHCLCSGHFATLKLLVLGAELEIGEGEGCSPSAFTSQQLVRLCNQCKGLEHLAVGLAPVTISESEEGSWGDFGLSVDAISKLPHLKSLLIHNLPVAPEGSFLGGSEEAGEEEEEEEGREVYELRQELNSLRYLERLDAFTSRLYRRIAATRGLKAATCLPYLSFGGCNDYVASEEGSKLWTRPPRFYYQAACQTSKYGTTQTVASRISNVDVAYELGVLLGWGEQDY
ncbi:hypothetical protein LTR85_003672 [Meristemomyces frigidus]|nr:hypothetical protein LTR85_003672 [Meristemomyces frigidus]